MSHHKYTDGEIAFLREQFPRMRMPKLIEAFASRFGVRLTVPQMASTLRRYKIRSGRPPGFSKGEVGLMLTDEQIDALRLMYQRMPMSKAVVAFNEQFGTGFGENQLRAFAKNHPELGIRSGRDGRFQKGNESWNKGLNYKPGGRCAETQFKKGRAPANRRPMYSERVSKDGYVEIKVPEVNPHTGHPTRFRLKHVWLWEQHHGPVPDGHVVMFRDGDKMNCVIENLVLATRAELARLNKTFGSVPGDMREAALAVVKVERRVLEAEQTE